MYTLIPPTPPQAAIIQTFLIHSFEFFLRHYNFAIISTGLQYESFRGVETACYGIFFHVIVCADFGISVWYWRGFAILCEYIFGFYAPSHQVLAKELTYLQVYVWRNLNFEYFHIKTEISLYYLINLYTQMVIIETYKSVFI